MEKEHKFDNYDTLKIPYLNVNTEISYGELCNKELATNKNNISYITSAIQQVDFSLNNEGGDVTSRGTMQDILKKQIILLNLQEEILILQKVFTYF